MNEQWDYTASIDDMTEDQVRERITAAMEYENPNPIRTIPYLGKISQVVSYESSELVARCPMTGYLDFYRVLFTFTPENLLPELKSLKLYYFGFADLPISHEHLSARIYTDFCQVVKPVVCRLEMTASIRGGIATTIHVGEKEM